MGHIHVIISVVLFATAASVHGFDCPVNYCVTVNCTGVKPSSCPDDQIFMPFTGVCGCCPGCAMKIRKGERCPGLREMMDLPNTGGCEENTTCKKLVGDSLVCD